MRSEKVSFDLCQGSFFPESLSSLGLCSLCFMSEIEVRPVCTKCRRFLFMLRDRCEEHEAEKAFGGELILSWRSSRVKLE